jgi:hypothetical protein
MAAKVDFSENNMTGGMPPKACYAPMKKGAFQRRLDAQRRAEDANRELYRDCPTTGGRPPKDCCAPLKAFNLAVRRRNEAKSSIPERRAAVGIRLGVPPLRLGPLPPRGGARHGAHGGPREAQPAPPAPPVCLSAVSVPALVSAPDPRDMSPPRR